MDPCDAGREGGCDPMLAACEFNKYTGNRECICDSGYEANDTENLVPGVDCIGKLSYQKRIHSSYFRLFMFFYSHCIEHNSLKQFHLRLYPTQYDSL